MTTYPLPTLAAQVTEEGISAPSFNDILQSLIATFKAIYGSDVYLEPDSQDYQLLAAFAMAINDQNQTMIAIYNGFSPVYAQGTGLSALVKINGLARMAATNSTAVLTITGVAGTVIEDGVVQDQAGNFWTLPPSVTIPSGGTISVSATCQTPGAISAAANTITQIVTVISGWQSVTNPSPATVGVDAESDAALRTRQAQSTSISAQTPLSSILAAVANVVGVTRYAIYENSTGSPDGNGVPGHSIAVVVEGGDVSAVALAIEATKSPGTGTYGTTSETVNDPAGLPITINFFELANTTIYVAVTIHALNGYVSSTGIAIVAAIVNFINSLPIGQELYFDWVLAAAVLPGPLGLTYKITSVFIGTAPSPSLTADIPIAFNAAAASATADVTLTVS
jgi:uncharacterized phage protein gp47/JayE